MKIYLRKIFDHDTHHEISVTKEIVSSFFEKTPGEDEEFNVTGMKSNFSGKVVFKSPADPRLGGEIKTVLKNEAGGELHEGDIILFIKKNKDNYIVEVINKRDSRYSWLSGFLSDRDRHLVISTDDKENDHTDIDNEEFPRNRIIFGAPGTGKSYKLNKDKDNLLNDGDTFERVTFHPDYSYANFVGCYKPIMRENNGLTDHQKYVLNILKDSSKTTQEKYDILHERFKSDSEGLTRIPILLGLYCDGDFTTKKKDGSVSVQSSVEKNHGKAIRQYVTLLSDKNTDEISYEYIPGPFIRVLVNALKDKDRKHKHLLVIEEINRANVAAVFGDIFQLLDRDSSGESEYGIQISEDLKKYLAGKGLSDIKELKIPNNMYIWATMNSADQGVFPMDTAFKRRWNFEYISINEGEEKINTSIVRIRDKDVNWNSLRKSINNYLSKKCINEDKLMGPFFLSPNEEITMDILKYKVLMYLHEDVIKHRNIELYVKNDDYDTNTFSGICEYFKNFGIGIFNKYIQDSIKDYDEQLAAKEQNKITDNAETSTAEE